MEAKIREPKTAESVARLIVTADGSQSWLHAQSYKPDCDLILEAKGDGKVKVDGSPVLTVDALTDVDGLAEALANVTVIASSDLDGGTP